MSLGENKPSSDSNTIDQLDERTPLLQQAISTGKSPLELFTEMEMFLQVALLKVSPIYNCMEIPSANGAFVTTQLRADLENAHHEPRLKGPFPIGAYALILQKCQRILDILHSMRIVTVRPDFSDVNSVSLRKGNLVILTVVSVTDHPPSLSSSQ